MARLQLRRLLRRAREQAGLTQYQAAAGMGWSHSKVSRIEAGVVRVSLADTRALLSLYGAGESLAAAAQLAQASKGQSWTTAFRHVLSEGDRTCWELEPHAAVAHYVDIFGIPILLRTEEFARPVSGCPGEFQPRAPGRQTTGAEQELMEPATHIVITAVVAGGAALAAATDADRQRPGWLGVTVVLAIVAVVWGRPQCSPWLSTIWCGGWTP